MIKTHSLRSGGKPAKEGVQQQQVDKKFKKKKKFK